VHELDGVWSVHRLGGLLPPMLGVEKRISGERGVTSLGPLPGVPFTVVGREFRYRSPFTSFVDVLDEVRSEACSGRATFRGRVIGRFSMQRIG
jgi:hypothetical protein